MPKVAAVRRGGARKQASTRPDARRKRAELVQAATALFAEVGFDGASIGELVKRTGTSKATIYSHFGDKEGLFIAVTDALMERHLWPMEQEDLSDLPLRAQLRLIADRTLSVLLTDEGLGLVRMFFGHANRFPDMAKTFYEHSLRRATRGLAQVLAPYTEKSMIKAEYFWAMLMHQRTFEGFLALNEPMNAKQRRAHAERVINDFLAAFIPEVER